MQLRNLSCAVYASSHEFHATITFANAPLHPPWENLLNEFKIHASLDRQPISSGTLHIRSEDAASLPFLEDGSVDTVLGMNVIYFLNPLDDYLR